MDNITIMGTMLNYGGYLTIKLAIHNKSLWDIPHDWGYLWIFTIFSEHYGTRLHDYNRGEPFNSGDEP